MTMREMGRRLGVSRSALYRHFADKDALLVAVAASGFEHLHERLRLLDAGDARSGLEPLRRMGEEYVRFAIENPTHYQLMYGREAITREDRPELLRAAGALFDLFVSVIKAHQRRGAIRRQDPRTQAYVAWSAMHGLASLVIEGQIARPVDLEVLIRQATRTLLDGMRARPRGES